MSGLTGEVKKSPEAARLDRAKRIAEAAYYRAEKRGFAPGFALEDWLAAEALIEFELRRSEPK